MWGWARRRVEVAGGDPASQEVMGWASLVRRNRNQAGKA